MSAQRDDIEGRHRAAACGSWRRRTSAAHSPGCSRSGRDRGFGDGFAGPWPASTGCRSSTSSSLRQRPLLRPDGPRRGTRAEAPAGERDSAGRRCCGCSPASTPSCAAGRRRPGTHTGREAWIETADAGRPSSDRRCSPRTGPCRPRTSRRSTTTGSLDHLRRAADHFERGMTLHFDLMPAHDIPVGRFVVACRSWGIEAGEALALLAGSSPASAASAAGLAAIAKACAIAGVDPHTIEDVRAASPAAARALDSYLADHGWRVCPQYSPRALALVELPGVLVQAIRGASVGKRHRHADVEAVRGRVLASTIAIAIRRAPRRGPRLLLRPRRQRRAHLHVAGGPRPPGAARSRAPTRRRGAARRGRARHGPR